MRRILTISLCALALNITARVRAAEFFETMIDVDGVEHCGLGEADFVFVDLPAGDFDLVPVGPTEGGAFLARNPWGAPASGCDDEGAYCDVGWRWNPSFMIGDAEPVTVECICTYETAELSLENAITTSITLDSAATIAFFDPDRYCRDNWGGYSIQIVQTRIVENDARSWARIKQLF